jgi:hypothetical protein
LARDADQLFIEAPFLDADANIDAEKWSFNGAPGGRYRQTSVRRATSGVRAYAFLNASV